MNIHNIKHRARTHSPVIGLTLRNPPDCLPSLSLGAHNRRVSGFTPSALHPNPHYARTSDTRQTLCTI